MMQKTNRNGYEEIYLRDYAKKRGTTRQTVYSAIERDELDAVNRFGNKTFILMNDKGSEWRPQKKYIPKSLR